MVNSSATLRVLLRNRSISTRTVYFAGITNHPTGVWASQAARNLLLQHGHQLADARARVRDRASQFRRLRRDLQNRRLQGPQDTSAHPRGERVRRTLDRHPSTRAPRPHHHLEPPPTREARRRLHRSLQHAPAPPLAQSATPGAGDGDHRRNRQTPTGNSFELSERHAMAASSTNTEEPPDQPRHSFGHPQASIGRASPLAQPATTPAHHSQQQHNRPFAALSTCPNDPLREPHNDAAPRGCEAVRGGWACRLRSRSRGGCG